MGMNGPSGQEWGELRSDVTHIAEIVARIDETVAGDHDKVIKAEAWAGEHIKAHFAAQDAHEKLHTRERGILGAMTAIGTAAASVLAWFK